LFLPNPLPLVLSLPVLAFLFGYSYAKRFTVLAHFWLGAALMAAPVAAWIALRGETLTAHPADLIPALVLGVSVLFWVAGFDMIYACQDAAFDADAKLLSVPARFGVAASLRIAAACHLVMVLVLAVLPVLSPQVSFGPIYYTGVAAVAVLLLYEHWIVRPDDLTRVNIAFFHVNWIVSMGLFVVGTVDLLV
jgi:4-hydroxybenzoate polyprenyltransferase